MEFPSKNLLVTLAQDLKILNNVNGEILCSCKGVQINSWLYPSKSYEEVSEICVFQNKSGKDLYLNYLELIVDRLYFMINVLGKFVEMLIKKDTGRNVVKPTNMALGTSSKYLWKTLSQLKDFVVAGTTIQIVKSITKLQLLTRNGDGSELTFGSLGNGQSKQKALAVKNLPFPSEPKNQKNKEDAKKEASSVEERDTQTSTYSAETCNSCCFATECIHEIVNELAVHIDTTFGQKIRQDLRENLYDITLQGRMNRVTTAIVQDLKLFGEHTKMLESKTRHYHKTFKTLESRYVKSLLAIKALRRSLKKVRKSASDAKIKRECLIKRINELIKIDSSKTSKIVEAKEKARTLEVSLRESRLNFEALSASNDKLAEEVTRVRGKNATAVSETSLWKDRFGESYLENRKLKQELDRVRPEILALKAGVEKLSSSCANFMERLQEKNQMLASKSEAFEAVVKKFAVPEVEGETVNGEAPTFKITGDPLADMMKQVELNVFNIKKLEQHNYHLLKTINRVQDKPRPARTSSKTPNPKENDSMKTSSLEGRQIGDKTTHLYYIISYRMEQQVLA